MALIYTGRSSMIVMPDTGKKYIRDPKEFARNFPGQEYDGTFDKPIPGMTQEMALHLMAQSNMHSFELAKTGEDLLDKVTTPDAVEDKTKK